MPFELSADQKSVQDAVAALMEEADGKKLRRELAKNLREAVSPAIEPIKAGLMDVGHHGLVTAGEGLRAGIASGIKAEARLTGKATGARIKIRRTPNLRGFTNAAKRLNKKVFRHRVFGKNIWVEQMGNPHYFENPILARKPQLRDAVMAAVDAMLTRIARRTEGK